MVDTWTQRWNGSFPATGHYNRSIVDSQVPQGSGYGDGATSATDNPLVLGNSTNVVGCIGNNGATCDAGTVATIGDNGALNSKFVWTCGNVPLYIGRFQYGRFQYY